MRWKPALNAFDLAFELAFDLAFDGRLAAGRK
jgi:hypothetical protein